MFNTAIARFLRQIRLMLYTVTSEARWRIKLLQHDLKW